MASPNSSNIQKLYQGLSQHYDVGTLDDFTKSLSDTANIRKAYQAASQHFDVGDFGTFQKNLGVTSQPGDQLDPAVEQLRQSNMKSALAQSRQGTPFQQAYAHPFSSVAGNSPRARGAASILDLPMQIPGFISQGAADVRGALNAPNFTTGALEGLYGLGQAGLGTAMLANPLPFLGLSGATQAASSINPAIGEAVSKITNPVTSFANPQDRAGRAATGLADIGAQLLAQKAAEVIPGKVGGALENAGSRLSGKAFGVGENYLRSRQLGKFAQEHGYGLNEPSLVQSGGLAKTLNSEINGKIIDPATRNGAMIDASQYINAMQDFKGMLEKRAVPDRASILAVDRMIKSAQARADASDTPGYLTPSVAQQMKVENNQILSDVYKKLQAGGNMTEKGQAKKVALMEATDDLRGQLEQLHPELRNLNWHEGQALQLNNAIYDYLNKSARSFAGSVSTRTGINESPRLNVYDVLRVRPIAAKLGVVLGKAGRALSGNDPDIVTGVTKPLPVQPKQLTAGPIQAGMEQPQSGLRTAGPPFYQSGNKLLGQGAIQLGPEGVGMRTGGPPFVQPGVRLLPPSNVRYAPEYQSQSQNYPNAAPQMADYVPPKVGTGVAPIDEAPVSRGGNMNVRGKNNQAQIDKFWLEGKLTLEQAIKYGVSPELIKK